MPGVVSNTSRLWRNPQRRPVARLSGMSMTYGYGSISINTIFRGMNIHLPAMLMFTRGTRFWHTAIYINGDKLGLKLIMENSWWNRSEDWFPSILMNQGLTLPGNGHSTEYERINAIWYFQSNPNEYRYPCPNLQGYIHIYTILYLYIYIWNWIFVFRYSLYSDIYIYPQLYLYS